MNNIAANELTEGQSFIHNYAGGNRTVYTALRVRSGAGKTVITYKTDSNGYFEFYCPSLSTLTLV